MVTLAHLTDLHLRPPGELAYDLVDTDAFTVAAIDAVNARHDDVDAVLVTGDVTDLGEPDAYARAAMLLSRFAAPVLVIPGNHDRTGPFREAFATLPGVGDEPVPGKACHSVAVGAYQVTSLDTSLDDPAETGRADGGELGARQLEWLDGELASGRPTLIAMHHPPFAVGIDFMDAIGLADAAAFERVVERHDNVVRIVCGHVHRTIVSQIGGAAAIAVPGVAHQVGLALSKDAPISIIMEPPAYAIHLLTADRALTHIGYVEPYPTPQRDAG